MKNQKQEYRLPDDEEYEDDDYENQQMDDEDEEEDQVAETVGNRQSNLQETNNSGFVQMSNPGAGGFSNVQMNPNFQYPGMANQNRLSANPQQNAQGRLRPQSAKTADDQQLKFQQQVYQNQMQNPAWVGSAVQQNYMNDPSVSYQMQQNPAMNNFTAPYMQGGFYSAVPQGNLQNNNPNLKKRPTTAQRRNNAMIQFGAQKKAFGSKNPSTIDLEISKLRPKIINQERERLYDDAMKQKMAANYLKDENTRLKTKIQMLENELVKKEKLVDDLLAQQDSYQVGGPVNQGIKTSKLKLEGHLAQNLKRKIRDLQMLLAQKTEENELLRRNIKSTKQVEFEVEMKMYMDECTRLRHQLEEVIKSKDTFADPEELKIIEGKFAQQDALINQLRSENSELASAYSKKEDENRQLREIFTDIEKKSKKAMANGKEAGKLKKQVKSQDKEIKKLSSEVQAQKSLNEDYRNKIEELIKKGGMQSNTSGFTSNLRPQSAHPNSEADKRLKQEISEKDQKIQELNNVVSQLQTKLQEKINELNKESQEKNKFKQKYEEYQDQVIKLEAQLEDGDFKKPTTTSQQPKIVKQVTKKDDSKEAIKKKKDQSYSSSEESKEQEKVLKSAIMKPRVEKKLITDVVLEIKLKLQSKGFYSNQIQDFFFKPYNHEQQITVKQLENIFETNGLNEKKSQLIARYIIEPKQGAQVSYSDDNSLTQKEIIAALSDLVGHYSLYNDQNQIKKFNEQLSKLFGRCKETLKDTLQLEDYEDEGMVPVSAFKEAFSTLDLKVDEQLYDYLIYVIYQRSEGLDKMKYQLLFDLIEGKLIQGQLSVGSNEGSRKRPESSSPEKLKARNKDKFAAGQSQPTESEKMPKSTKQHNIEDEDEDEDDDKYEEEFEKLIDKDDEDQDSNKVLNKGSDDEQQPKEGDMDEEDGEYVDEEVMLDVAEKCFVRIAEAIIKKGHSVRQAFASFIIKEEIETEDGQQQIIELLSPIGFLEGIKDLGITDLEEIEVACLMRVLTKADLENAILLRELIVIMENFGIQDDEDGQSQQNFMGGADDHAEQEIERESNQINPDDSIKDDDAAAAPSSNQAKKKKKKKGNQAMDLSQLDEKSIKIMAKLMLALMELNVSLYEFFEGVIYEQLVKTKTKQNKVEILNVSDFYDFLQRRGVRKSNKDHENLTKFLQLDPNYPNLLMLKKIAKTLDEMAKNEELMAGILAAAEEDLGAMDMNGGEQMDDDNDYQQNEFENSNTNLGNQQNQQRLITIGEDEEERHFETNKDQSKGGAANQKGGVVQKAKASAPYDEDEDYEEDQKFEDAPVEDYDEDGNDDYEF